MAREEDLALFLHLRHNPHSAGVNRLGYPSISRVPATTPTRFRGVDDLFKSDADKNDYDWLLTPPATPLYIPFERETNRCSRIQSPSTALKTSRLSSCTTEVSSRIVRGNLGLKQVPDTTPCSPSSSSSSSTRKRQPLASAVVRPPTPTLSRPLGKPSIIKPPSSSSIARQATPSTTTTARRSSSVNKATSIPNRSGSSVTRGSSPSPLTTRRPTTKKLSAHTGFPVETPPPPNLRTSLPAPRSSSNSRGTSASARPGAPAATRTTRTAQPEGLSKGAGQTRRQSFSPIITRGRRSVDGHPIDQTSREMIEKVMQARKLMTLTRESQQHSAAERDPPSKLQAHHQQRPSSLTGAKMHPSKDSLGFGRTLSKSSLDTALQHMDIRRSMSGIRPLMPNIPSALISRSGLITRGRSTTSVSSNSPMATSSTASSERSFGIVADVENHEHFEEAISRGRVGGSRSKLLHHPLFKEMKISSQRLE